MAKSPTPSASVAQGERAPDESEPRMPTYAELEKTSAAVALPHSITNGVPPGEFLRYGLPLAHLIQTKKLSGDKFPAVEGFESPIAAVVGALNNAYRVVDQHSSNCLVTDGTLFPYTKVFHQSLPHSPMSVLLFFCVIMMCVSCCWCYCCVLFSCVPAIVLHVFYHYVVCFK